MNKNKQQGQAMIILLFVTAVVISLIVEISVSSLSSISLDNEYSQGVVLLSKAEGYLESAALRYIRDPNYTGETIDDGQAVCQTQVNDIAGGKEIVTSCQKGERSRKVAIELSYSNGIFSFLPVEERE